MLKRILTACLPTLAALPAAVDAGQKPLWELGLGVGAISFPDYPGSDQQRNYVVPVPYLVYRGKILKADKEGVQAKLFDTDRVESYLSLSASPPVSSSRNHTRSGMPDLKPMVEFGPALEVHLWRSANNRKRLDFRMPVRAVFTIESSPHHVGWLAAPVLNLDVKDVAGKTGWDLGTQIGMYYADRRYNQTMYGVAPIYATADRPAYEVGDGYAGSQFTVALSKRFDTFWAGTFLRYESLRGAVFDDSPLVRRENNFFAGIGIAWIIGQSSRMVESND
jgi:outer membrane protein